MPPLRFGHALCLPILLGNVGKYPTLPVTFSKGLFCISLAQIITNHLGLPWATNKGKTDCIWVEKYFKKSF